MKIERINYKYAVFFLILLKIIILCNISCVHAAENIAPTECRVSINDNAKYTNNRFVTLELYGVDESAMQVWISNDGDIGTVLDFEYNKTISITDVNYAIGTTLTSSNSTTTTNSDNVLRIENWPLSSINGSKKVYVVFRDAYGNITPITGLSTIDITYYMNDNSGIAYDTIQTVKNLGVYTPTINPDTISSFFKGWSESPTATIPNYSPETIVTFTSSTNLYAVYGNVSVGDYVYYPIDLTKSYSVSKDITDAGEAINYFNISDKSSTSPAIFRILEITEENVVLCPNNLSQVFSLSLGGLKGFDNGKNVISSICSLYESDYSYSTSCATQLQMSAHTETDELKDLVYNTFWVTDGWTQSGSYNRKCVLANCTGSNSYELNSTYNNGSAYRSQTAYVLPAITLKTNVVFSGKGTKANPYTLNLYDMNIDNSGVNVGDYVMYPLNLNNTTVANKTHTTLDTQTFALADKYAEGGTVFRIVSKSEDGVLTIGPADTDDTFTLSLYGKNGNNNGVNLIQAICDLYYVEEYCTLVKCMPSELLRSLNATPMGNVYTKEYFTPENWSDGYAGVMNLNGAYTEDIYYNNSGHTVTKDILPEIQLKSSIQLYGEGTFEDPYLLGFNSVQYTISYDTKGGTNTPASQIKDYDIPLTLREDVPTKDNCVFLGWATSPDATEPQFQPGSTFTPNRTLTLYAVWQYASLSASDIAVGSYVYYNIDSTKSYKVADTSVGYTQNYYMSNKFSSEQQLFRVLEIVDGKAVLCPANISQVFSLRLNGDLGATNGPTAIRSICALYSTALSESTSPITHTQIFAHANTEGLNQLFTNNTWVLNDWGGGSGVIAYLSKREFLPFTGTYAGGTPVNYNYTNYVIPTITLNSNVTFSGEGTSTTPYTLATN